MKFFDFLFRKPQSDSQGAQNKPVAWKEGDRVLAMWRDTYYYPGRLGQASGNTFQVLFDDGDVDWVQQQNILSPDIFVGSRVQARVKGGPFFAPGIIRQQKGETIQVQYDNGEEEWTSISMVRVERAGTATMALGASGEPAPAVPSKPSVDLGDSVDLGAWQVGDRVLARWWDFYWYPGTILGAGKKGIHILFDDGDQRIIRESQLMPLMVEENEHIFIRPKNEQQRVYYPAVITRVRGESIDVEFEDGTLETNTRISRARFWHCPVRVRTFEFEEGDRVLATDCDEYTYPAEIVSIQDDRIIVQFLDGPERMLTPELIRPFKLSVGDQVECRWKGGPHHFPGRISQLEGERAYIKYDDGDEEWTTIRLVRLPKAGDV